MSRGGRRPSETVLSVLAGAEKSIWNTWEEARNFVHHGSRGDTREESVREFLRRRLPEAYGVRGGEAVDHADRHSKQLDVLVYDKVRNCPLIADDPVLLPVEAVLAVIEVKSILTQDELNTCYQSAQALHRLHPFRKRFTVARRDGQPATPDEHRCFFTIFAYESNLSEDGWLEKEWDRAKSAAEGARCAPNLIDRILVLKRGLISPPSTAGKTAAHAAADVFHDWFVHLVNFLARENGRRPATDWQAYSGRHSRGWRELT